MADGPARHAEGIRYPDAPRGSVSRRPGGQAPGCCPGGAISCRACTRWVPFFSGHLGKLPNALSSPWPGKTYVATSSACCCSRYSMTGNPIGRIASPSSLSSNRRQLASVSASAHFRPIISLRRHPVGAIWRMMSTVMAYFSSLAALRSISPSTRYSASHNRRCRTLSFGSRIPCAGLDVMMPASTA